MSFSFDFSKFDFHPVVHLPMGYVVYDWTKGFDTSAYEGVIYGVGRYNEKRPGMYSSDIFQNNSNSNANSVRDIHVGIDLEAPAGTEVRAFYDGWVHLSAINSQEGDYGGTIITGHQLGDRTLWALHGHLSHESVSRQSPGSKFKKGDVIAYLGERSENGGWDPHLHFQLSWVKPEVCDLPGVVNEKDLEEALKIYPDPRLVLGPLY